MENRFGSNLTIIVDLLWISKRSDPELSFPFRFCFTLLSDKFELSLQSRVILRMFHSTDDVDELKCNSNRNREGEKNSLSPMIYVPVFNVYLWNGRRERSHLITEWGDRKPKNIYLCKNTQNCQKCSAGNLWFLLTKKLPKCLRCWRNNFAFERQINKFTFCAIETVETDEKKLGQRQISRNLFYYWQLLFCRSIDYRAPHSPAR